MEIFKYLLNLGGDIDIEDNEGNSIFFIAVQNENKNLFKYLIKELKVNVNKKRNNDIAAIHLACANGDVDLIEFLL